MLLAVAAVVTLYMYFFKWNADDMPVKISRWEISLGYRTKMAIFATLTTAILYLASDWNTLIWLATVEGISCVHSLFRPICSGCSRVDFAG
jgi:hypothetical protein